MITDRIRKARVFLGVGAPYWRRYQRPPRGEGAWLEYGLPPYPLDFVSHVRSGHYRLRGMDGLPINRLRSGAEIRNYTRLCGFAIGQLQAHEETNAEENLANAIRVARYIEESAQEAPGGALLLRAEIPGRGHVGQISAMSQGMAMSVLARTALLTGNEAASQQARALAAPFREEVGPIGVRTIMCHGGCSWYEEDTTPPVRHILNGMVFAQWGLQDLSRLGDSDASQDYRAGMAALVHHAADFDAGWWSWYHLSRGRGARLASAHYHQLHACQLSALGGEAPELLDLARRFEEQLRSPTNRLKAAVAWIRKRTYVVI